MPGTDEPTAAEDKDESGPRGSLVDSDPTDTDHPAGDGHAADNDENEPPA
jgi:hypothetical protein